MLNLIWGESDIDVRTQSVIMTLEAEGGRGRAITNDVLKLRKMIEFQSS